MRRIGSAIAIAALVLLGLAAGWLAGVYFGAFGRLETAGRLTAIRRPPEVVGARGAAQRVARASVGAEEEDGLILFGDLHVHTTFSMDAFLHSLPLMQGEGAHPPADACDFARFCSSLDFFSLNDHAEGLTPDHWRETVESLRQCNAVAGGPSNPDLVAFLGWEWTQMSAEPDSHWGHKNVIFRDLEPGRIPTRPIAAAGRGYDAMRQRGGRGAMLAMTLADLPNRQRYYDFDALRTAVRDAPACPTDVAERDLPDDCVETATTPRELFAKLDDWGFPSLVIPHGNAWGNTTPAGVSWDKQLTGGNHDPAHQRLIEVYSGHGNSEQYRRWRHVVRDASGTARCPEPTPDFEASCWRAGEIIRARCLAAGESASECEGRAQVARERYLAAGEAGRFVVPGATAEDWLDSGQCRDCFQPAFEMRPGGSTQYALAASSAASDGAPVRFRFGFISSSDNHSARAGTGYKELGILGMTDAWGTGAQRARRFLTPSQEPRPESVPIDPAQLPVLPGGDIERSASFYYTGGLVAVHAARRDRAALWDALVRREVYATSGPRILLWFDLLNPPGDASPASPLPMGSEVRMSEAPRFRVRALGALHQKPGCPEDAAIALDPERLQRLCKGECYNPDDVRYAITRIEVVRIRPRVTADEDVADLVEDPWRILSCPAEPAGCAVEFEDPEHATAGRDAVYYVRAIQEPTPQINGDGLRCEVDERGRCVRPHTCMAGDGDDCLGDDEARAWSSPIFVDFGALPQVAAPADPG